MIAKLFRRLTADSLGGDPLFQWATRTARERDWYVNGSVPDTIDGRFALLSTMTALCCLRLEQFGNDGDALSVALTERFAEVMESEHRELGLGDPTLGKTVLKLVGSLGRRVDLLRPAVAGQGDWAEAARASLPGGAGEQEVAWRARRIEEVTRALRAANLDQLSRGDIE